MQWNWGLTIWERQRQREKSWSKWAVPVYVPAKIWDYDSILARTRTMNENVVPHVKSPKRLLITMPKFRDTIFLAHASRLINAEEFVLLYNLNPKVRICLTPTISNSMSTRWRMMNVNQNVDFTKTTSTTWQVSWLYQIESFATMMWMATRWNNLYFS